MKRYIDKETGEKKAFGNLQVYVEAENSNERQFLGNFNSFKQIFEYYEDYIPKEPLIKDEKIRKAVRAWAEANAIVYINRYDSESFVDADGSTCIDFDVDESIFNDVPFGRNLTIDELCGEEK